MPLCKGRRAAGQATPCQGRICPPRASGSANALQPPPLQLHPASAAGSSASCPSRLHAHPHHCKGHLISCDQHSLQRRSAKSTRLAVFNSHLGVAEHGPDWQAHEQAAHSPSTAAAHSVRRRLISKLSFETASTSPSLQSTSAQL